MIDPTPSAPERVDIERLCEVVESAMSDVRLDEPPPMWENRPCRNSARWEYRGVRFCFAHKPKRAVRVDDKERGR